MDPQKLAGPHTFKHHELANVRDIDQDKDVLNFPLPDDLLKGLDNFPFDNPFETRTAALHSLIVTC